MAKSSSRTWVAPAYSRGQVNRAGEILAGIRLSDTSELLEAIDILENWRSSHLYPLNTFQSTLRSKVGSIDNDALVAQRLKRLPSIIAKLRMQDGMKLARMQDIVGLRAVVRDLREAKKLISSYKETKFAHQLKNEFDYIVRPKASGYRSHHLVYQYVNESRPEYNGLLIELQIRTKLQHSWAMAVETMGVYLNSSLKSGLGPDDWKGFFAIAGSAFACLEKTPVEAGFSDMTQAQLFARVAEIANELNVIDRLQAFAGAAEMIVSDGQAHSFFIIDLRVREKETHLTAFSRDDYDAAARMYTKLEQETKDSLDRNVVLVSAGSIVNLKRAYPSYFLDTGDFVQNLLRIVK